MAAENATGSAKGEIKVDGCHLGGHVKPANHKAERKDRRPAENQTGKREVVMTLRERGGRTFPFVIKAAADAVVIIRKRVAEGSTVHADEARRWDSPHARHGTKRSNHRFAFSDEGACTNQVESLFSRLRRAEMGQHHRIRGPCLRFYAGEAAWREDNRRWDNGAPRELAGVTALGHAKSRNWCGYWQRHAA